MISDHNAALKKHAKRPDAVLEVINASAVRGLLRNIMIRQSMRRPCEAMVFFVDDVGIVCVRTLLG